MIMGMIVLWGQHRETLAPFWPSQSKSNHVRQVQSQQPAGFFRACLAVAVLTAFAMLEGCAENQKRSVVTESTKPYLTGQPSAHPNRESRVISVRPSPKNIEIKRTEEGKAFAREEKYVAAENSVQPVAPSEKIISAVSPLVRTLSEDDIAKLIPDRVADRSGWARDILKIFAIQNLPPSPSNVCQVLMVIQQESGFQAIPPTEGMNKIAIKEIEQYGRLVNEVAKKLADVKFPGEKYTYWERIKKAKTEYELDHIYREAVAYYKTLHPNLYVMAESAGSMVGVNDPDKLNKVTTAGSMQVSVRFAQEQAKFYGIGALQAREFLYTRYGGMYYGTLRLLGYRAGYTDQIYRFADYNLGMYASRNAAVQQQLSELVGKKLDLDGDLLRYSKWNGSIKLDKSESEKAILAFAVRFASALDKKTIRNDLYLEKSEAFENTKTYLAIKQVYTTRYGTPAYARLPSVEIKSPKIKSKLTTAQFAKAVNGKYQGCLKKYELSGV